jgi:Cu+-exporting ATPase
MVETTLLKVPKVQSARVNLMTAQAVVEIVNDDDDDIESNTNALTLIDALEEIGKEASMVSMEETRDDDTAGSILPNQQQQQRRVQYQFALQGLTCSSCQSTVDQAIRSMQHVTSVQVSLFPEATLRMVVIDRELVTPEHVISIIEDVGFDAVLVHQESLDEGLSSNKDSRRVVLLTFADAQDAHEARTFLLDVDCVQEVSFVEEMSKPKKKMTIMPSKMNYKRGFIYMDEEAVGQATVESTSCILRVTFVESLEMGIRTLLRAVEEHVGVASKAAIKVQDAVGFQTNQEAAEARRRLEIARERRDFFFALAFTIPVTIIAMVLGMIPSTMHYVDKIAVWHITWEELTTWILTTPVQFISGFRFYRESYYSLKTGHYGMGLLICLGTSAAYFYSVGALLYNATGSQVTERLSMAFETSALLITFVILGKYLEHKAKARTSKAISSLAKLSPQFATLVGTWNVVKEQEEDCPEEVVDCILVQRDDILMVKPGENVPSDGVVVNGCTSIDESMLTGESMPVVKQPGDAVIGGTVNLEGSIRIRVTKVGGDTAMAQIIRLIESAQSSKAPVRN